MKLIVNSTVLMATISLLALMAAPAGAADTGFATQVNGRVDFQDGSGLAAFTKLRSGDRLRLGADAKLQLVYFDSGRQETWNGSCTLLVGERESGSTECQPPVVKQLAQTVMATLQRTPDMISDIRSRSGMVRVRAFGDDKQISIMEANYKAMREQAADDDITPELYLFSRQWTLQLRDAMAETLATMARRQPDSLEVAALQTKYQSLLQAAKSSPEPVR